MSDLSVAMYVLESAAANGKINDSAQAAVEGRAESCASPAASASENGVVGLEPNALNLPAKG